MEEKSLRITGANTTFFNKLTNTLTRMLIPTKIGINSMKITLKRNSMIKAYDNYKQATDEKKVELEKKYEESYTAYLETLDKYVMDSIYKKVKNGTASDFERDALSRYYQVTSLKDNEYNEYKYRKQKYLLELDKETVENTTKEKIKDKYIHFYIEKMDLLYRSILKNYSIKIADTTDKFDTEKENIYNKIFYTLDEYATSILPIKMDIEESKNIEEIKEDYEKYESYSVGKLDTKDIIEKNAILLSLSRKLFTHSIPLVVAEQCYEKLLKDTRILVQDTKMAVKREIACVLLMNLIEEYNVKLLSTKVYWETMQEKDNYKKFWDKYKKISKLKEENFDEYKKQKEVLFIKDDIRKIKNQKFDYSRIIKYYKRKLLDYGAIRQIKNTCKSDKNYKGNIDIENRVVA